MVKLYDGGAYLVNGTEIVPEAEAAKVEALTGKKAEKSEAGNDGGNQVSYHRERHILQGLRGWNLPFCWYHGSSLLL